MVATTKLRFVATGLMASALVAAPATAALAASAPRPSVVSVGALKDLSTLPDPTDGAHARFAAVVLPGGVSTRAVLVVTGLDPSAVGSTFGAHVHVGKCVAGAPLTAGAHYNAGGPADAQNEIWLDITVLPGGIGVAQTVVPFTIPQGAAKSVVIHAMPTGPGGLAGPRLACLPVKF